MAKDNNEILKDAAVTIGGQTIALSDLHEHDIDALYAQLPNDLLPEARRFTQLAATISHIRSINEGTSLDSVNDSIDEATGRLLDSIGVGRNTVRDQIPLIGDMLAGKQAVTDTVAGLVGLSRSAWQNMVNNPPSQEQAEVVGLAFALSQQEYYEQQGQAGPIKSIGSYFSAATTWFSELINNVFTGANWSNLWQAIKSGSFGAMFSQLGEFFPSWADAHEQAVHSGARSHAYQTMKKAETIAGRNITDLATIAERGGSGVNGKGETVTVDENLQSETQRNRDGAAETPTSESKGTLANGLILAGENKIATAAVGGVGVAIVGATGKGAIEGVGRGYIDAAQRTADKAMEMSTKPGDMAESRWGHFEEKADARRASKIGQFAESRAGDDAGWIRSAARKITEKGTRVVLGTGAAISTAATGFAEGAVQTGSDVTRWAGKITPGNHLASAADTLAENGHAIRNSTHGITDQRWFGKGGRLLGRLAPGGALIFGTMSTAAAAGGVMAKDADATAKNLTTAGYTAGGTAIGAGIGAALGGIFGFGAGAVPGAAAGAWIGGAAGGVADLIWGDETAQSVSNYLVNSRGYHSGADTTQTNAAGEPDQGLQEAARAIAARVKTAEEKAEMRGVALIMRNNSSAVGAGLAVEDTNFNDLQLAGNTGPTQSDVAQQLFGVQSPRTIA